MFKAKVSAAELAALPEPDRKNYAEKDGEFVFQLEPVGGYEVRNYAGLSSAYDSEKTQRARAAEERDRERARAEAAEAKVAGMAGWTPDAKAKELIEAGKKDVETLYQGKLKERDAALAERDALLDQAVRQSDAIRALGTKTKATDLALPHLLPNLKMVIDPISKKPVVRVYDAAGNERNVLDSTTGAPRPMTVEERVAEMEKDPKYSPLFPAPEANGMGTSGGARSAAAGGRVSVTSTPNKEQLEQIAKGNFVPQ